MITKILFETVRSQKKSKLILFHKYGSQQADSLFDLFVIQNGYSRVMECLINTFLLQTNERVF